MSSSRRSSRASISDGDFILDCKAAYIGVMDDVRKDITSKNLLLQALQDTGRNPTKKTLQKYWKSDTERISYDDFVDICRKEHITTDIEMMKAFRKIDINGDGYISNKELRKVMTTKGEKMSEAEVQEIIDEVDENGDGKLDYKEFCKMMKSTTEELRQVNRKRLEKTERRSRKVENYADSKRGDVGSMGSQISVKSNSSQRTALLFIGILIYNGGYLSSAWLKGSTPGACFYLVVIVMVAYIVLGVLSVCETYRRRRVHSSATTTTTMQVAPASSSNRIVWKVRGPSQAPSLPTNWDNMTTDSLIVPLPANSDEYVTVHKEFKSTIDNYSSVRIIKIDRIQNKSQYQKYIATKDLISSRATQTPIG